jgi:putative ABC transport system substrate-binding protein
MRKLIFILSTTAAFLIVGSRAFGILGPTTIDPMGAMRLDHFVGSSSKPSAVDFGLRHLDPAVVCWPCRRVEPTAEGRMAIQIGRRQFVTLLGGAATAWPLAARAQQPAMPVIGYLSSGSRESARLDDLVSFRQGLSEMGYVEGRSVAVEYRWADNNPTRLTELTTDLVRRRVAVISASSAGAALAAKAATTTIPIVFSAAADAIDAGLVTNLGRPNGNLTGVNMLSGGLTAKHFELLHELVPQAMRFGLLVNPNGPTRATITAEARAAAMAIGRPLEVLAAGTNGELDEALASLVQKQVDALVISPANLFTGRRVQIATSAVRYGVPTAFGNRNYAESGGLISYGPSTVDLWHQVGIYVGRILKGEKPADLPVLQPTKFVLVINTQTAGVLGIVVPPALLARADEVIE